MQALMSGTRRSWVVTAGVVALLALTGCAGQEFKEELCGQETPFCWVHIESHHDCEQTCLDNAWGPQKEVVNSGEYTGVDGHHDIFPHWVCRAKGDGGEGWRSGFNLKGYNDGTTTETSCNIAAHGAEVSQTMFECLCTLPFPFQEPAAIITTLSLGWVFAVLAAAAAGAFLATAALYVLSNRDSLCGLLTDPEIAGFSRLKTPLTSPAGGV